MADFPFVSSLLDATFTLDFQRVTLTRLGGEPAEVLQGPGTLSITAEGRLQIKILLTHSVDAAGTLTRMLGHTPGTLLPDDHFSRVEAMDYAGQVWACDRARTTENLDFRTNSGTVAVQLASLERTFAPTEPVQQHRLWLALPGEPAIPYTRVEERNGAFTRSRLDLTLEDGTQVTLRGLGGYILLEASRANKPVDEAGVGHLVEGISIATGRELRWIYRRLEAPSEARVTMRSWSRGDVHRHIWGVMPDHDPKAFEEFVRRYRLLCADYPNSYFGSWRKILDAWHVAIVTAALPICVYTESVVKEFFPAHMKETETVVTAVDGLVAYLETSGYPPHLISRAQGAVRGIKGKSVTTALKGLAAGGWFKEELVQTWQDVRHKSAHGNELVRDPEREAQSVLTAILGCLQLFYILLLIRIRFPEEFHDLSQERFPKVRLDPDLLRST